MISGNHSQGYFKLHPQLEQDTLCVGELSLCKILLMDDRRFLWLILIPKRKNIKEIIELTQEEALLLMGEVCLVSNILKEFKNPDKLNVAALGNMVPQLHIHVIARFISDAAWPQSVWGIGSAEPYAAHSSQILLDQLRDLFADRSDEWVSACP